MKEVKGLLFFNMKNSLSAADSFFLYGERYDVGLQGQTWLPQ